MILKGKASATESLWIWKFKHIEKKISWEETKPNQRLKKEGNTSRSFSREMFVQVQQVNTQKFWFKGKICPLFFKT